MASLYEALLNPMARVRMSDEAYHGGPREIVTDYLPHAQRFNIDNVADYYYQEFRRADFDLSKWRIDRDFPNIAPPCRHFWMEFRPNAGHGTLMQVEGFENCSKLGVLFLSEDLKDKPSVTIDGMEFAYPAVRWLLLAMPFNLLNDGMIVGPHLAQWLTVNPDGQYVGGPASRAQVMAKPYFTSLSDDVAEETISVAKLFTYPCLLAMSFLHCRNVVATEQAAPRAERRRAEREGRPAITFKTLDIRPMQEVLRREGQIERSGLRKALHFCRGHFATYTPERPLFGKVAGTFYIPQHVRGSAKEGVVVKDYDVKAPAEVRP